jgi:CRISP-associated protein Cas1
MRRVSSVCTPVAHVVGPGKLKLVNGQLAFSAPEAEPLRLDPQALRTVLCYGPVGVSDEAVAVLFRHDVDVAWLTPAGTRCRGRLVRSDPSKAGLRLVQHRAFADAAWRRQWACWVVEAKIGSQLLAVRHYQRHGCGDAGAVVRRLQEAQGACAAATVEALRGIEGGASAAWFGLLGRLLVAPWTFMQRVRRPPTDPVNALLSLGYTWLLARVVARCEAAGLEVYLGGLHEFRPGRPSLACDLMEPLRVPVVDRWVLGLCNEGRATPAAFMEQDGGVRLQPEWFGRILADWEKAWLAADHDAALDGLMNQLIGVLRAGETAADGAAAPDEDL